MEDAERDAAIKIYRALPGRDCGERSEDHSSPCGSGLCRRFALKIVRGEGELSDCPYLNDRQVQAILLHIDEYFR